MEFRSSVGDNGLSLCPDPLYVGTVIRPGFIRLRFQSLNLIGARCQVVQGLVALGFQRCQSGSQTFDLCAEFLFPRLQPRNRLDGGVEPGLLFRTVLLQPADGLPVFLAGGDQTTESGRCDVEFSANGLASEELV